MRCDMSASNAASESDANVGHVFVFPFAQSRNVHWKLDVAAMRVAGAEKGAVASWTFQGYAKHDGIYGEVLSEERRGGSGPPLFEVATHPDVTHDGGTNVLRVGVVARGLPPHPSKTHWQFDWSVEEIG